MAPCAMLAMQPAAEDEMLPVEQEDEMLPVEQEAPAKFAGDVGMGQLWDEHSKLKDTVAMLTRCLQKHGLLETADEQPCEQVQPKELCKKRGISDWMTLPALARVMGFAGPATAGAYRAVCRSAVEIVDQTREQAIVVFGGNSVSWPTSASQLLKSSECLQTHGGDAWEKLPDLTFRRSAFAGATLGGCIYVCGGGGGTSVLARAVSRFGTGSGSIRGAKWASVAPMGQPRTNFAVTAFGGRLYACGGFAGDSATNSAERYSPGCGDDRKGSWQALPPMSDVRQGHAAVALGGQILVSGGSTGLPGKEKPENLLTACETFDPSGFMWWQMPDLNCPRRSHTMEALKGMAVVCGGLKAGRACFLPMTSTEIFNPCTQAWFSGAPMMVPRQAHQSVVFAGRMYVLGGVAASQSAERSVEVYEGFEGEAGSWRLAEPMVQERAAFVAATMLFDRIATP